MLAFISIKRNIHPKPIGTCDTYCIISTELGISCCHTFCAKMEENVFLKLWNVHYLLRAGSRRQASLRKTDAVGVRENLSSGPAKPGKPLRK
jgi:hypothetical protein